MRAPLNTIPYDGPISYDEEWEPSSPVDPGRIGVDQTGERPIGAVDRFAVTSVYTAEQRARVVRASIDSSVDLDAELSDLERKQTAVTQAPQHELPERDVYDYAGEESYQRSIPRPDDVLQVALGPNDVRFVRRVQVEEAYFQGILHDSTLVLEASSERWRSLRAMIEGGTSASWRFPPSEPLGAESVSTVLPPPPQLPEPPPSTVRPVVRPPASGRTARATPPPLPVPGELRPPPLPQFATLAPPPLPWERRGARHRFEAQTQSGIVSKPAASAAPPALPAPVGFADPNHPVMLPPAPSASAAPQVFPLAPPFARRVGSALPPPTLQQAGRVLPPPRSGAASAHLPAPPRPVSAAPRVLAPAGAVPAPPRPASLAPPAGVVGALPPLPSLPFEHATAAPPAAAYAPPHYPGQQAAGSHESFARTRSALNAWTRRRSARRAPTAHQREWAEAVRENRTRFPGARHLAWVAMFLTSGAVLHRQGVLYEWSEQLGLTSLYTATERALVGGPAEGEEEGLAALFKRRPSITTGKLEVVTTVVAPRAVTPVTPAARHVPAAASAASEVAEAAPALGSAPEVELAKPTEDLEARSAVSAKPKPSRHARSTPAVAAPADVAPPAPVVARSSVGARSAAESKPAEPEARSSAASRAEALLQAPNPYETTPPTRESARSKTAGAKRARAESRRPAQSGSPANRVEQDRSAPSAPPPGNALHAAMRAAVGK